MIFCLLIFKSIDLNYDLFVFFVCISSLRSKILEMFYLNQDFIRINK